MRRNQQELDYHNQRVINEQFQSFGAKAKETPRIGVPESVSPRQPVEPVQFKIEVEDEVDDGVNSYQMPNTPMDQYNQEQRLSMNQPYSVHMLTKSRKSSQRYQSFKNNNNQSIHASQVSSQTDPPFRGQSIVSDHMRQKIGTMRRNSNMMSPDNQTNNTITKIQKEEPSYRHWVGEQLFFLGGRIQIGINVWQPSLTFVLINVLMTASLSNTMRDLQSKFGGYEFFIFFGVVLQVSGSVLLWVTAMKDPATIPSRRFLVKTYNRRIDHTPEEQRMQKYMDVLNGRITRVKYCEDCDIYRPPRTIHCGLCGCCIERLDHHCPWIGTCVGKRNYKYFLCFLWCVFLMVNYGIIFGCLHISKNMNDGEESNFTIGQILSIVIVTLASFLGIFVFFLFGYHQYLLCRNETTNENLKKTFGKLGNPFYRGCFDNMMRLCRRDKRNWKPEEIVVREEERNDSQRQRMSQPRQLHRQSYTSSMQGGQHNYSGHQDQYYRQSSAASRNQNGEYDIRASSINDERHLRQQAHAMNIQRESELTNMNGEYQSNHENPDMRQSQQAAKPISNQELNKLFGSNINEGRRSKNRRTSQESELAKKANAEALQRLQSNAMNYDGEEIMENHNEDSSVENFGREPIGVNDIKIDEIQPNRGGNDNIKLPLNNGISAMNTEQQISVLDQSDEQVLEEDGLDGTRTREDQLVKSDLKSQGIYQTSTTQKAASSNLGLNPNVSNLMNSIQKGQQQYKNKKE